MALLAEAVLADETGLQEQLDGVASRTAHLGTALLHPIQQGVHVEMPSGRIDLLEHSEALRRFAVPTISEEGFEAFPHLFQQT